MFNVPLGSKDVKSFRFMHYLDEKSDYSCKLASGDAGFSTEASIVAHPAGPEGIESEVDVAFEPTRIGSNFKDTLLVKSAVAGEFICPVIGRCIAPKPQGPFDVKGKGVQEHFSEGGRLPLHGGQPRLLGAQGGEDHSEEGNGDSHLVSG